MGCHRTPEVGRSHEAADITPRKRLNFVSTVRLEGKHSSAEIGRICGDELNVLSGGAQWEGRDYPVGPISDVNDSMILDTLGVVELAVRKTVIPFETGGVQGAIEVLAARA